MLITSLLSLFIFIVAYSVYYVGEHMEHGEACDTVIPIPIIGVLTASMGFFIGNLVYYILSTRFIKKRQNISKHALLTLKFLPNDERRLIRTLIEAGGSLNQSALTKKLGMTRVKAHRVIERLIAKGVIIKKKAGQTNSIIFDENLNCLF